MGDVDVTMHRRDFIHQATLAAGACVSENLIAQTAGERPQSSADVTVINPRARVPVGLIIDDSTCLVNLNRFAVPQFAHVQGRLSHHAQLPWREWPVEIPDSFVRKFGEWAQQTGVKGKYSIVPYPACVGRLDRMLPGWTVKELEDSIELVRTLMMPNWDIHPEMVTHTRVIDLKTGHPHPEFTSKFMENWDWSVDRSADEMTAYMTYALGILKNIGLKCEGITTPGGFGSKARPQLAQATLQSVRDVFGAEVPHYFRDVIAEGTQSVAPLVQNAAGLDGSDPRCVVHIIACTGDWTGGWDATEPGGVDKFITADGSAGRMVDIITRGEPAMMLAHWTGIYHNGKELGFTIMQEVVKRLHAKYDNLHWMKLGGLARYWAAKELTAITSAGGLISFNAPFACAEFTVRWKGAVTRAPLHHAGDASVELKEAARLLDLKPGTWCRDGDQSVACFALPKGASELRV